MKFMLFYKGELIDEGDFLRAIPSRSYMRVDLKDGMIAWYYHQTVNKSVTLKSSDVLPDWIKALCLILDIPPLLTHTIRKLTMQTYSGYEYLLIDIANTFGNDKMLFEERIQWVNDHMDQLEELTKDADKKSKPLYIKAVQTLRKVQRGEPTGHMVALDATCSGIQIMSAITGCVAGATSTGLVDPNRRADAYTDLRTVMMQILDGNVDVNRSHSKEALMTSMYGSKAKPKEIFGVDTPELNAFYEASRTIAPGACELMEDLMDAWQPYALYHAWKLPDGFDARIKVMEKQEDVRISVDELDGASFTYEYYENKGTKKGISLVANVIHSIDAYVLRSMHRRCNYDDVELDIAMNNIQFELKNRKNACQEIPMFPVLEKVQYYLNHYNRTKMADPVIFPWLKNGQTMFLSSEHLEALYKIGNTMLAHKPFPLITIHDSFAASPNNCNHVRQHYIDIFAELADSNILQAVMSDIYGQEGSITKLSGNLSELIRNSEYALS